MCIRDSDNAIADFTAALVIKTDDAALYVARGQAYDLNGQYDPAIADFDAALKLAKSPVTLAQRASSELAKGDYDRAVAGLTEALDLVAKDPKDARIEAVDIYSERGYAEFLSLIHI